MDNKDGELLSRFEYGITFRAGEDVRHYPNEDLGTVGTVEKLPWKRFAILPNVDGQKYTIGQAQRFAGREEQGEFIFLSQITVDIGNDSACEINVERNKYFLKPVSGDVYINDVKVGKRRRELKFGDKLSLGVTKKDFFRFRERQLEKDSIADSAAMGGGMDAKKASATKRFQKAVTDSKVFKGEFTPGQNWLILSRIMSYLPSDQLKRCRFVGKLWNEEAFRILKKRRTLILDYAMDYDDPEESMKLFRYSMEMNKAPYLNWKIILRPTSLDGNRGAKLLEDLNYFLLNNTKVRHVKQLELGGDIRLTSEYELQLQILQTVGDRLEILHLSGKWLDDGKRYQFPENIQFPKLQCFTLAMDGWPGDWLPNLIFAIRNVSWIRLYCTISLSVTSLNYLAQVSNSFNNLREITLDWLDSEVLPALLKLDKPLKKLEVGMLMLMHQHAQDLSAFDELLLKHAQTLESLEFVIPRNCANPERRPVFIHFPKFPQLENLRLGWDLRNYLTAENIMLAFPDGRADINYGMDLPSLTSLTLWPDGFEKFPLSESWRSLVHVPTWSKRWKGRGPMFEMFFPAISQDKYGKGMEVCNTLRFLDILHEVKTDKGKSVPLFPKSSEAVIAAMFPNVNNEWIQSIRKEGLQINTKGKESEIPQSRLRSGTTRKPLT